MQQQSVQDREERENWTCEDSGRLWTCDNSKIHQTTVTTGVEDNSGVRESLLRHHVFYTMYLYSFIMK